MKENITIRESKLWNASLNKTLSCSNYEHGVVKQELFSMDSHRFVE